MGEPRMPRTGLVEELARKYGISVSEVKSRIMKAAIAYAKTLQARGTPWRTALGEALRKVWAEVKATHSLPALRY